jgi:hypothetical protein
VLIESALLFALLFSEASSKRKRVSTQRVTRDQLSEINAANRVAQAAAACADELNYDRVSVPQLKSDLRKFGLRADGNNRALFDRLKSYRDVENEHGKFDTM